MISVVIPTYARPTNLIRAIESVLNQTYSAIEIIVVDDNGLGTPYQEETERLLCDYILNDKIKYITHEVNKNGSAARNTGFRASQGEYVAFLDDDDEFLPAKLQMQVDVLMTLDTSWGGCYCDTCLIDKDGNKRVYPCKKSGDLTADMLLEKAFFNTSTLLLRRKVIEELDGFDESYNRHQDWEFLIRFFRKYKLKLIIADQPLLNRYTADSIAFSKRINGKRIISLKKKFLGEFKNDICRYSEAKEIFVTHWLVAARHLRGHGKKWWGFVAYLHVLKYRGLKWSDLITFIRNV